MTDIALVFLFLLNLWVLVDWLFAGRGLNLVILLDLLLVLYLIVGGKI